MQFYSLKCAVGNIDHLPSCQLHISVNGTAHYHSVHNSERKNWENSPRESWHCAFRMNGCFVMFVWCETFPRCLSIDGWTALRYYDYARNHNQQYTQKLNIQQQSIKITTVNMHLLNTTDSNPGSLYPNPTRSSYPRRGSSLSFNFYLNNYHFRSSTY